MRLKTEARSRLAQAWDVQARVVGALIIRELNTRFGRDNIGFLWIVAEPLLFAGLVAIVWTFLRGNEENGIGIVAFVISGYLPLTLFRHAVSRCTSVFIVNGSLLYHRQIKILDFIFVRVLIEMAGGLMAYIVLGGILAYFDLFPVPSNIGTVIAGWMLYSFFTLSVCLIIAPLSEISEAVEKFVPVTTYIMIPFSGTFNMAAWLSPKVRDVMLWSPPASAMEIMRYGLFGDRVRPYYDVWFALVVSMAFTAVGLTLSRHVRKTLVVE